MLEHETPVDGHAHLDQVGGGIVGLGHVVHPVGEKRVRVLRERVDEKPVLRPEEAVKGSRAGARPLRDGTHREGERSAFATSCSATAEGLPGSPRRELAAGPP